MTRYLPIAAALGIILAAGAIQGIWTDRWAANYDFDGKQAALKAVPLQIGDWAGRDLGFDPAPYKHAGIRCGLERLYVNSVTGQSITMLIVGGAPGPISVHLPETCYAAAGYEVQGTRIPYAVPESSSNGPGNAFWIARFENKTQAIGRDLSIHYAWSPDGRWTAPEGDARLAFASQPALFKMYVIQEVLRGQDLSKNNPCETFIRDALGPISRTLFSGNIPDVSGR